MRFLGAAVDLVWPSYCAGCGRPGASRCPACARLLRAGVESVVAGVPARGCAPYEGTSRQVLLAVKERGRAELRTPLARDLAHQLGRLVPTGPVVLVPVPTRRANRRARGGDLVADLAARTAAQARRDGRRVAVARCLRLVRRVRDQTELDAAGRAANLRGAFAVHGPAPTGPCVVVDDVLTTGATAGEAVRALRAGGARVNGVLTVVIA